MPFDKTHPLRNYKTCSKSIKNSMKISRALDVFDHVINYQLAIKFKNYIVHAKFMSPVYGLM